MTNAWRVIWHRAGKRVRKTFEGDAPRPAIDFAKKLKERGVSDVEVHSVRKAFVQPFKKRHSPGHGYLWCPYCVQWREFRMFAVRWPDLQGQEALRCPVCFISVNDHYVRRYNEGNPLLMLSDLKPVRVRVPKDSPASRSRTRRRR